MPLAAASMPVDLQLMLEVAEGRHQSAVVLDLEGVVTVFVEMVAVQSAAPS